MHLRSKIQTTQQEPGPHSQWVETRALGSVCTPEQALLLTPGPSDLSRFSRVFLRKRLILPGGSSALVAGKVLRTYRLLTRFTVRNKNSFLQTQIQFFLKDQFVIPETITAVTAVSVLSSISVDFTSIAQLSKI